MPIWLKYLITAALVVLISEVAKRSDRAGALIGAMPWVAILAMIWIFHDNRDASKIVNYSWYTFWYVLPTLPMFLLIPWMLHKGLGFGIALLAGIVLTVGLLLIEMVILKRYGIALL
ncbi:MAG: DUF3147 family protein [Gammaproteobacteria bacterium]|nr:DUF3147 family protein [Gammaproteobacteria bacterium]